ncbi:unnamed protein product [Mytilus coruscus]|uniref:Retrotransposon gag domain-containing protein n=1 Tax=Mytilus coruscus TaxID=42192 RepID=A0A6J8E5V3_MYTCO|nr:unnamed protein product [Mytilus coruscus]
MNDFLLRSKRTTLSDLSKIPIKPVKSTIPPDSIDITPVNPNLVSEAKSIVDNAAAVGTTPDKNTTLVNTSMMDRTRQLTERLSQPLAQPPIHSSTPDQVPLFKYTENDLVNVFPLHVSSTVQDWFYSLEEGVRRNLQRLKEAFLERFQRRNLEYSLQNIKQHQSEAVDDYINRILAQTSDSNVREAILVSMLVGGLRLDLAAKSPRPINSFWLQRQLQKRRSR